MIGYWDKKSSSLVYGNPWIQVREDQVINPAGKPGVYAVIEVTPFAIVAAINQSGEIATIKQHRYPQKRTTTEFPAGGIEAGESPLEAAKRELLEETGLIAKNWQSIGKVYESISITNQTGHVFIATSLSETINNKMSDEGIHDFTFISSAKIATLMKDGSIRESLTHSVYALLLLHGALPETIST